MKIEQGTLLGEYGDGTPYIAYPFRYVPGVRERSRLARLITLSEYELEKVTFGLVTSIGNFYAPQVTFTKREWGPDVYDILFYTRRIKTYVEYELKNLVIFDDMGYILAEKVPDGPKDVTLSMDYYTWTYNLKAD